MGGGGGVKKVKYWGGGGGGGKELLSHDHAVPFIRNKSRPTGRDGSPSARRMVEGKAGKHR